ncbi:MAG: NUDIX hydrolase [Phyllobacterium sp.]
MNIDPSGTRPQGVSIVCQRDGRFLLVERGHEPAKGWLAFPGGRLEEGETTQQAAKRELFEETALAALRFTHLVTMNLAGPTNAGMLAKDFWLAVYLAHDATGEAVAGDDAAALFWLTPEEMAAHPVTDSTLAVARKLANGEYNFP